MREILFRGKRLSNGGWIYGDLVNANDMHTGDRIVEIWSPLPEGETDPSKIEYGSVNPDTVGEWTGLYDCRGIKIFEGDIVKYGDNIGVVNFGTGCFCVKQKPDYMYRNNPAIDIIENEFPNEMVVIGNKWEHAYLLEGAENG